MNSSIAGRLTCLVAFLSLTGPVKSDVFEQNRRIGRGVNILGYDPIWRSRDEARFQPEHFRLLKEAGFQSVRINLQPFRHMDGKRDWALSDSWFTTLDWAIQAATDQGLMVILDCHEFNALGNDAEGNHAKFLSFWKQLSTHCAKAPDNVVFELLNEPFGQMTAAVWNTYLRESLAVVRETNPNRTVIVGPASWNAIYELKKLELPASDANLIVTIHYYLPLEFTHQGAPWSKHKDLSGIEWPGTEEERGTIQKDFAKADSWAKEHKRPIFVGEFGAYEKAPMESRVRYTSSVARTAESFGWSWAYWQFDSDFILYDIPQKHWVAPIRDALILKAANSEGLR